MERRAHEAFGRISAPSIVARIQPANHASMRVASAVGLAYESQSTGRAGEDIAVLRLTGGPSPSRAVTAG